MQNERFTTSFFPKCIREEDLAEQVRNEAANGTAQGAEEPCSDWEQVSPPVVRLNPDPRCLSATLTVFNAQCWWLSLHLYLY